MRLIDAEETIRSIVMASHSENDAEIRATAKAIYVIEHSNTIVEFEGDINKVIVKGKEYHKQIATTWLGNFCPYRCGHCGRYVDSKERYCPNCGRKAVNYE